MDHLVSRLRFRHLRLLCALAEARSLHAAAIALNVTQPAVSKALREIEEMFGCAFFDRSGPRLRATPHGEVVVRGARLLLQEVEHLRGHVQRTPAKVRMSLRLGAPPTAAAAFVPGILARLAAHRDTLEIELIEDRVPRLFEAVADGELDAIVSTYNHAMVRDCERRDLHWEKLGEETFGVIAPAGQGWRAADTVSWARLAQEPWILPASTAYVREMVERSFARAGLAPPIPWLVSTSPTTNVALVAQGAGVAAVPMTLARMAHDEKRVVWLKVTPRLTPVPVALIYRQAAAGREAIQTLRRAAVEV